MNTIQNQTSSVSVCLYKIGVELKHSTPNLVTIEAWIKKAKGHLDTIDRQSEVIVEMTTLLRLRETESQKPKQ
jgi:hypothetical protein